MTDRSLFRPSRRRILAMLAAGATALAGRAAPAYVSRTEWHGRAFGAEVSIVIADGDVARAQLALEDAAAAIERLENALSLYRPNSGLVRLNAAGQLDDPPSALVDVFNVAQNVSALSDGAFDATVQPLWSVYANFAGGAGWGAAGFGDALERAWARVGWRHVRVAPDQIDFAQPDMAATLNGVAQGYAADRVVERLRAHGFRHVLADLGEFRALGGASPATPWRVGIEWPQRRGFAAVMDLRDRALATSSPYGTTFDRTGERHHLFDPRTGRSAHGWTSVSVVAATATVADALSTAIAVAPMPAAEAILAKGGGLEALLIDRKGHVHRIRA
jgi:FAD:protein FMN transferase